tara:strand:+ start:1679 stop:2098 length:420 start_codon:yes stop_codon:yes gene_type:complete
MGERANILLYQKRDLTHVVNHSGKDLYNYSPVIYTHWGGYEIKNVVQEVAQHYKEYTGDANWEVDMRTEVERVFPKLLVACIKNGLEPSVFNFDMLKFKYELPKGNDMPIVADDWGTLLVDINSWSYETLEYDWQKELT